MKNKQKSVGIKFEIPQDTQTFIFLLFLLIILIIILVKYPEILNKYTLFDALIVTILYAILNYVKLLANKN